MRNLVGTALVACLLLASPAAADVGWYLSIEAGVGDPAADRAIQLAPTFPFPTPVSYASDEGFVGLAAIGAHLAENFRLELEVSRRAAEFGPIEIDQTALLLNAAFDIALTDDFSVSLGAGAGFDLISMDANQSSEDDTVPALQLIAGLTYEVAENTEVLLTLRHFGAPGSELGSMNGLAGDTVVEELSDTSVTLGLRFGL